MRICPRSPPGCWFWRWLKALWWWVWRGEQRAVSLHVTTKRVPKKEKPE